MFPGMNPRQMQQAMKKMGIRQESLEATQVIIRLPDRDLIFDQPEVAQVNMMGQNTYQIVGEPREELLSMQVDISDDDVQTVIDQTGVSKEVAYQAIEDAKGDLAEAILALQEDD